MDGDKGNGKPTIEQVEHGLVLTLIYDQGTHQVAIGGAPMPLSLAMMIVDEGKRVLEEQRRLAMMQNLNAAAQRQAMAAKVAEQIFKKG
jgi:hypothetical protein